ncbi:hypothetical protein C8F04DRAFT_1113513 [Mycena alexandri]|uniref:Uncharacterized protein n=1 Tax=Mycena alexandri TaxID=1745969 RepID=A0AAD6SMD8_9AGAR|nr:hypothetical protein C8F04DRAFT_1113513 [Mycena alexandri]
MAHSSRTLSRNRDMSFSEGIFSPAAEANLYILANVTPEELHSGLVKALTVAPISLTQRQIDGLLATFQSAGIPQAAVAQRAVANETLRHCVRCHQNYLEKNNGREACIIFHDPLQPHAGHDATGAQVVVYTSLCCPGVAEGTTDIFQPHFRGRHTTMAISVSYNFSNIRQCTWLCAPPYPSPEMASGSSTPTATTSEFDAHIHQTFAHVAQDNMSLSPTATESDDTIYAQDMPSPVPTEISDVDSMRAEAGMSPPVSTEISDSDSEDSGYMTT